MSKRIVGVSPWSPRDGVDYDLMKAAGIEWVRQNSEFPFGRSEEDITPQYTRWFDRYKEAKAAGMKQACVSPIPAGFRYNPETGKRQTYRAIPDWAGSFDSDRFYEVTYRAAKKLAEDTRDYIDLWQVSNEMDILEFHGEMTLEQAARYLSRRPRACAPATRRQSWASTRPTRPRRRPASCTTPATGTIRTSWITSARTATTAPGRRARCRTGSR